MEPKQEFMESSIKVLLVMICLIGYSCDSKFRACNDRLNGCTGVLDGEFCLFGYKWGSSPTFEPIGLEVEGPGISGGEISYSFQTNEVSISIHNRRNTQTLDFSEKGACARDEIRRAFEAYESIGDFSFSEEADNSNSDIQLFIVNDEEPNVGNANYQDELCSAISGYVVFNKKAITDCHNFYILALHEIGHAMGLGHVTSSNVMKPGTAKFVLDGLQEGDINGIVSIYGSK